MMSGILLGLLSATPWLLRHEALGFILLSVTGASIIVFRLRQVAFRWLRGYTIALVFVLAVRALLPIAFHAVPSMFGHAYSVAFVHDIAGIVAHGGVLDFEDRRFVQHFADPDYLGDLYTPATICCSEFGSYRSQNVDQPWLAEHKATFVTGWWRIARKNVRMLGDIRWVRFSHHIGLRQQWLLPTLEDLKGNEFGVGPTQTRYSKWVRRLLERTDTRIRRVFVWSSLWPLLALLAVAILSFSRKDHSLGILAVVPLLHVLGLSTIQHAGAARYHFYLTPVAVMLMLALWVRRWESRTQLSRVCPPAKSITRRLERDATAG